MVGLGLFRDVSVRYEGDGEFSQKLTLEPREGSIVRADLAILVGAGLATQFRHSPITSQQNPPSPPITEVGVSVFIGIGNYTGSDATGVVRVRGGGVSSLGRESWRLCEYR
ncbi:hypothetical protein [Coleofasciculus sp. F4-SAH-05]|uniref:hypothetical protein n=1 Tax=Coleofasciculus sp. F4-SAH-05 TaxID=3069525 RepID=UPI0032F355EF